MTQTDNTMLINLSQTALSTALDELESAKDMLKWAKQKLVEAQAENRKLGMMLTKVIETPDPKCYADLLAKLDKPCGFVECQLTKDAAKAIRQMSATIEFLREENRRLRDGADS